jgi:hypothetical protein
LASRLSVFPAWLSAPSPSRARERAADRQKLQNQIGKT